MLLGSGGGEKRYFMDFGQIFEGYFSDERERGVS